MKILDGKKLSEKILINLKRKIKKSNLKLRLVIIQVGENDVSQIFIHQKEKVCQKTGIAFKLYKFPAKISSQELKKGIAKIVKNPINSGVIVQLPLPQRFKRELDGFLDLIPPKKDIDVIPYSPTVNGILYLLKYYKIRLKGKNIVIIGAGRLVGFPLTVQFLKEKATLSVLNEFTKDIFLFTKKADILISAVGKPNLIKGSMIKKGVVIIDAGCVMRKGKIAGDVDFKSVSKKASYFTPVPGGVGPMTVACLLENLVKLNMCRGWESNPHGLSSTGF